MYEMTDIEISDVSGGLPNSGADFINTVGPIAVDFIAGFLNGFHRAF
ncbi:hypothetical protein [Dyella tabacisoli]|nr:hypothetical protein [Dyella tabacisoli]